MTGLPLWRMGAVLILFGIVVPAATSAPQDEASAQASAPDVTLDALISDLLASNPELQAARRRWEAMQKRPAQESALPDPTLRFGWSSAGAPYPGAGLGTEPTANIGVEVGQMFPFPGKRGLRGAVAGADARAEGFSFQGTELNLVSRLKFAFHELRFVYDALDVIARNRSLLERLGKVAEARYEVGEATQQDLIKSQVEVSLIEARVVDFERRKQSLVAEINSLLNRDTGAPLGKPQDPGEVPALPSLESLQKEAAEASPALRARKAAVDGRQFGVALARREYYPDFEVMGGYFNMGSMKDMYEFRVQINIPLYFAHKQRLGLEEAGAKLGEAQKTYRAEEQMLAYKIKDQYLAAQAAHRLMDLYSKLVVPQATLGLESALATYGTGKTDFLTVLANFTTILDNEMNFYESRSQYLRALAALDELVGRDVVGGSK